jgi:N4-gp56 family major capsid protein
MPSNTSTSAAVLIQKVVSNIVQQTLMQESVMIPSISDYSSQIVPGMDRLDIPRFIALAPTAVVEGTPNAKQAATVAVDQLLMNINEAILWGISDRLSVQSKINMVTQLVKDSAKALAVKIDNTIIAELLKASAAAPDHLINYTDAVGNKIALGDIVMGRKLLNIANVPMADRYMLISPESESSMLLIDNFIAADKYGSSDAIQNGEIGRVYGFKVLMSTSPTLAGGTVFYHKSAVAYGSQIDAKFETMRDLDYLEDKYALSQLYGAKVLDLGKRQVVMAIT